MARAFKEVSHLVLLAAGLAVFLKIATGAHPQAVSPGAGPVVMRYRIIGAPGYSATDLKTAQTWILERHFKTVPGVIAVTSQKDGDAIVGTLLLQTGDRGTAEAAIDEVNRSGILPPGMRLEKSQTPVFKRDNRRARPGG